MSAIHLDYLYGLDRLGIKPGLERMEVVMEALGHPERQFRSIHISGTNGKGSVAAMMESVLRASGFKTALYTSPDIYSYHERTKVNGKSISDEDLSDLTWELKKICEDIGLQLTFFEFGTALAYLYFARQKVDIAVIEVGMGGLLDATNVITPTLSVITNVGLDHQEFLGETKEEIAREKAGIIKPGVPVVTGEQDPEILALITDVAKANNASLIQTNQYIGAKVVERSLAGQRVRVSGAWGGELFLPLLGDYQVENLKTVLATLAIFARAGETGPQEKIAWNTIQGGINSTKWEGRLDVVSTKPLIIVDGAHNADGMNALADFLEEYVLRRDVLIFGLKQGKKIDTATQRLIAMFDHVIISEGNYQPQRAMELREKLAVHHKSVIGEPNMQAALAQAQVKAGQVGTIVVAGSLYLIADALGVLRDRAVAHQLTETTGNMLQSVHEPGSRSN